MLIFPLCLGFHDDIKMTTQETKTNIIFKLLNFVTLTHFQKVTIKILIHRS